MLAWQVSLKNYWEKQKTSLLKNYPGIQLRRLEQVVLDLYPFHYQSEILDLNELTRALDQGIPLQYITGEAYFYKAPFFVNQYVLIPRSETEILVGLAKKYLDQNPNRLKVLDVGTGSGAIILSLLMDVDRKLEAVASDYSVSALRVAESNFHRHRFAFNPESSLKFYWADRLQGLGIGYDLIVTNPPYIKACTDLAKVHGQTAQYEPHAALFLPDSEYENWFEHFFGQIKAALSAGGLCLMEGHEDHLEALAGLAKGFGFVKLELIKDYNGQNRILALYN